MHARAPKKRWEQVHGVICVAKCDSTFQLNSSGLIRCLYRGPVQCIPSKQPDFRSALKSKYRQACTGVNAHVATSMPDS